MLTTYTYDKANRLKQANSGGVVTTYAVDAAGNRLSEVSPTESRYYTWDAAGRMDTAETEAGTLTFTYNADGQRIAKQSTDGSVTGYLYDGKRMLHETDEVGGEISRTYASDTTDEFGDLIGEEGEYVHQYDAQANTNALLDTSGSVEAKYKYDAFGQVAAVGMEGTSWSSLMTWDNLSSGQWAGMRADAWANLPAELSTQMLAGGKKQYYLDPEIELYLLGSGQTNGGGRYYDPAAGRFLSEDPERQQAGEKNLFAYVGNDPVNNLDPGGHESEAERKKREEDEQRKAAENARKRQSDQQNNDHAAQKQSQQQQQVAQKANVNQNAENKSQPTVPNTDTSNPTGKQATTLSDAAVIAVGGGIAVGAAAAGTSGAGTGTGRWTPLPPKATKLPTPAAATGGSETRVPPSETTGEAASGPMTRTGRFTGSGNLILQEMMHNQQNGPNIVVKSVEARIGEIPPEAKEWIQKEYLHVGEPGPAQIVEALKVAKAAKEQGKDWQAPPHTDRYSWRQASSRTMDTYRDKVAKILGKEQNDPAVDYATRNIAELADNEVYIGPKNLVEYTRQFGTQYQDQEKQRREAALGENPNATKIGDPAKSPSTQPAIGEPTTRPTVGEPTTRPSVEEPTTRPAIGEPTTQAAPVSAPSAVAENRNVGNSESAATQKASTTNNSSDLPEGIGTGPDKWKFNNKVDVDMRGREGTMRDNYNAALDEAFRRTGASKEEFEITKFAKTAEGKTIPVEWKVLSGPNKGAVVNVDDPTIVPTSAGPANPHVGYQTPGKRGTGGAVRGHIILDSVPAGRGRINE